MPIFGLSQSSYYSNPFSSSLYLNPSNAAVVGESKSLRIAGNYRYMNYSGEGHIDSRYIEVVSEIASLNTKNSKVKASIGGYLNQNVQGIGKLKNTEGVGIFSILLPLSDNKKMKKPNYDKSSYINFGMGGGFYSRSVDLSNLIFNDMIVSGSPNSTISNNFDQNRRIFGDGNFGLTYGLKFDSGVNIHKISIGGAIYNLNRNGKLSNLRGRFENGFFRVSVPIMYDYIKIEGNYISYRWRGFFNNFHQGTYRQSELGSLFSWGLKSTNDKFPKDTFLDLQLSYRRVIPFFNNIDFTANYLVIGLGFSNHHGLSCGMSFDQQLNTNQKISSGFNSVYEFYIKKKIKKSNKSIDKLSCQDF